MERKRRTRRSRKEPFPVLPVAAGLLAMAGIIGYLSLARPGADPAAGPANGPGVPISGSTIGGGFRLVDQNGRQRTDKDFAGRYRLIYFGYSFCPDICPNDLARMTTAMNAFARAKPQLAAKVQPIFVTVDPERDTPAALKTYAANFHPRLIALTGARPAIEEVKADYKVYAAKAVNSGKSDYLVDHSSFTYLFGPGGEPIALLDSQSSADRLLAMLEAYVR